MGTQSQVAAPEAQDTGDAPVVRGSVFIRDGKLVIEAPLPTSEAMLRANTKGRPYITVKPESSGALTFAIQGHAVEVTQGLVVNVPLKVRTPGTKPGESKSARRFTFGAK